ncbi:MAG: hypothetical protein U1E65_26045 [Myxococcota bacterium]
MNRIAPWSTILSFSLASGLFVACGNAPTSTENAVGEGAAYLVEDVNTPVDPSSSEAGTEGGATDADLDGQADEGSSDMSATPPAGDDEVCDFDALKARVIQNYDANGDGRLDNGEGAALLADLKENRGERGLLGRIALRVRHRVMSRVRWAFDVDGNGMLDETERATYVDAMEARCRAHREAVLAKYDLDHSGHLDVAERAQLRADRAARHLALWTAAVRRYDQNGDGKLDKTELKDGLKADFIARRQAVKAAFDQDGDGKLEDSEIDALKAAVRDAVESGGSLWRQLTGQA